MKKQSSIEWLVSEIEQLDEIKDPRWKAIKKHETLQKAKEMHKQEIIDAHESGVDSVEHGYGLDYYNETFKSE